MGPIGLIGLMLLVGLGGCSQEEKVVEPQPQAQREAVLPLQVAVSAPAFADGTAPGSTRAWVPPTGYYLYDDPALYGGISSYRNFSSLGRRAIDAFFTRGSESNPLHGRLRYVNSTGKWNYIVPNVMPENISAGTYYAYGYIPRDAAADAEISLPSEATYSAGAVLTIKGMRAAGYDACVTIGARDGFSEDYDGEYTDQNANYTYDDGTDTRTNRLRAGRFDFSLKRSKGDENYLYLLFDHLCAQLELNLRVDYDYSLLRTIVVKELHLATSDGTNLTRKMDVTVILSANSSGANPIESVTYTPTSEEDTGTTIYASTEGTRLTTSFTDSRFLTHIMPQGVRNLVMTWKYDVYDTNTNTKDNPAGNRVRTDCTATNVLPMSEAIYGFTQFERCKKYTVNVTVNPTYLYVMSDPDLDNPEMKVN